MNVEGENRGLIGGTILEGLRKIMKNFRQDRRYPGRAVNTGLPGI
jgi:hypothetical protein